jgi:predicted GIY-YIG superfamily endonuclease
MIYTVYIIRSELTSRYYVGHAENLEQRLLQHNTGVNNSTRHGIPWRLIKAESFESRGVAMKQELKIKKRGVQRYLDNCVQPG